MNRITKTVGQYAFGAGSADRLGEVVGPLRDGNGVVFLIDHFFRGSPVVDSLPVEADDAVIFVDTTDEPTTEGVDRITAAAKGNMATRDAVMGIGGGSTLDTAKAVSNLIANGGKAADYQGWDLVPHPGVHKIGVPTISGTGAEASRTCVMMNKAANLKLGMNSEFTVFDQLVLDPDLTATVPRDQYFFTGLDTYIHCIESLNGGFRPRVADAYSLEALNRCREIFLSEDMQGPENRERLMVASYLGGSAIGNSFVGVVHPLSAGLSMVLGIHHCEANCIVMNVMDEFYPSETDEFRRMLEAQNITLPADVCAGLDDAAYDALYDASIVHEKPLENALGEGFAEILSKDRVRELFARM